MRFQHKCFALLAQSSFYIDSIWFRYFAETRLRAVQLSILTNVYLSCLPCPRQLSRYSSPAANGKLASFSAATVADAVSCEFDGINVTAQHVKAQTAPLMRLLAFYDHFIKDYRGSQVSAH